MALSDLYVSGPIGGESGGSEYLTPGRSTGAIEINAGGDGPSLGDIFSVGKGAFKAFAPEAYADATSFIPSWSDIGGALGFEGGAAAGGAEAAGLGFMDSAAFGGGELAAGAAGGALGGAMAALGPAGLAYAVAQLLAAIPNSDGSVSYGSGWGDLDDGFTPAAGRTDGASGLYGLWTGDRDWYDGGDPGAVERLPIDYGSMSRDKSIPYYSIGGAQYRTPDLAVSSGRQIARGEMGLPVDYEPLPNAHDPITGAQQLAGFQGNQSMPVWDAPMAVPDNWDEMIQRRQQVGGIGEGANPVDAGYDAWRAALPERGQGFADAGLTRAQMFVATGEASPDWGAMATGDELAGVQGNFTKPAERDVLSGYNWGAIG